MLPTLLSLVFLSLFIALGVWQIHRYHYKKFLLQKFQQAAHSQPLALSTIKNFNNIRFQHVRARGYYINDKTMLVQNRIHQQQLGFEVLTPFQIEGSQKVLLVNRGWVPMPPSQKAPFIKSVNGTQIISGVINVLDKHIFILGKNILYPSKWPLIMQKIDLGEIAKLTHFQLYPFVLRLDANQANGYVREWKPINVKPQRHVGYALQWFGLAFALIIAYLFLSRKKIKHWIENYVA